MDDKKKEKASNLFGVFLKDSLRIEETIGFEHMNTGAASVYSSSGYTLILSTVQDSINFMVFIDSLLKDSQINSNYTRQELINTIVEYLGRKNKDKKIKFENLLNEITNIEKQEFMCVIPVYGVSIDNPISYNRITFLKYEDLTDFISKVNPNIDKALERVGDRVHESVFAIISVKSQSKDRALSIAENSIREYLNVFRAFIDSKSGRMNISLNRNISSVKKSLAITTENVHVNTQSQGAIYPVKLDDPFFKSSSAIEYLLNLENPLKKITNLEKRLFSSCQLVGESFLEVDRSTRFLKAIMSIEALIQVQGNTVTDIAFKLAHLLGKDSIGREKLFKDFKNLYNIRSLVAHGEDNQFGVYEEMLAIDLALNLIVTLIESDFKTFEDVEKYVRKKQFQ